MAQTGQSDAIHSPEACASTVVRLTMQAVWSIAVVCTVAISCCRLLQGVEIELRPTRPLFETATQMSIEINHPAYDCVYLALAVNSKSQFVTADDRFLRKLHQSRHRTLRGRVISLIEAVQL
jgi:predicted nucleic acid-binding protein